MTKKLYKVTCRGMQSSYGTAYVVAEDPGAAYTVLRAHLDAEDLGFRRDRELEKVELVAEQHRSPDCEVRLYL